MVLDLGCGSRKYPGSVGIDRKPDSDADIVADIMEEGLPVPDASCELVYSTHFMEHITGRDLLFGEIYRVLKPDGLLRFRVPYVQSPRAFSAHEHKQYIGEFWVLANVFLRRHFREITFDYSYDPELLRYARSVLPDAPLSVVRRLFWGVVWDMIVEMRPRLSPITAKDAIAEIDAEVKQKPASLERALT